MSPSPDRRYTPWTKVFSHDTSGGLFTNDSDTLSRNPQDPDAKLFSILDHLESMRLDDGNFHLKLCYPELTEHTEPCNEWIQTSNPVTISTIQGFHPIQIMFPTNSYGRSWKGLGMSPPSATFTFIDDAPDGSYWWMAIGARRFHGGPDTIPGPTRTVRKVELYVKKASL